MPALAAAAASATTPTFARGFVPNFALAISAPRRVPRTVSAAPAIRPARPAAPKWCNLLGTDELAALTRIARALAASRDEADELVQDGLMRAIKAEVQFDTVASLSAWMHTVMYRMTIDRTRRARRRRWDSAQLDDLAAPEADRGNDGEPDPWTGLDIGDVRAAAPGLPETLRHTFCLFAFERRSYEEIAVLVGVPVRTVGTRLCRARKKLRSILQANRTVPFYAREEGTA
jgi:RNA polymerase sigma-70 factor (ECF subfamily)